jgi:hypothetical protein
MVIRTACDRFGFDSRPEDRQKFVGHRHVRDLAAFLAAGASAPRRDLHHATEADSPRCVAHLSRRAPIHRETLAKYQRPRELSRHSPRSGASYDRFRTHGRPIRIEELQGIEGLRIKPLEEDDDRRGTQPLSRPRHHLRRTRSKDRREPPWGALRRLAQMLAVQMQSRGRANSQRPHSVLLSRFLRRPESRSSRDQIVQNGGGKSEACRGPE